MKHKEAAVILNRLFLAVFDTHQSKDGHSDVIIDLIPIFLAPEY